METDASPLLCWSRINNLVYNTVQNKININNVTLLVKMLAFWLMNRMLTVLTLPVDSYAPETTHHLQ